jgi:hypothetical protein
MGKWVWATLAALPLAAAGLVYATSQGQASDQPAQVEAAYTCPITGEDLPCSQCCPLNQQQ